MFWLDGVLVRILAEEPHGGFVSPVHLGEDLITKAVIEVCCDKPMLDAVGGQLLKHRLVFVPTTIAASMHDEDAEMGPPPSGQ